MNDEPNIDAQVEAQPLLPKRGGWKARRISPSATREQHYECQRLTADQVPPIPTEREFVGDGGLLIDAPLDGDNCRWRLTPRGEVRIFIRYWPKAQQDEKGPWKERYVMPDDLTTQAA